MNNLKEYVNMPEVQINGKKFVDEEILLGNLDREILEERKCSASEEERKGIDICRNIIANWRRNVEKGDGEYGEINDRILR